MIKARHQVLRLSTADQLRLRDLQQEAARCWNDIVVIAKSHYDSGNGWISKNDLQKSLKGTYSLHSQTVQGLTDRFCSNRKTAAENRRLGLNTRYPWRTKRFVTVPFKQMAIKQSKSGTVTLSLSKGNNIDTGIAFPADSKLHTCEILWRKGRYFLSCTSEYPEAALVETNKSAGIDIGEIHPVAITAEDGFGLIVSGREIRSIKRQRNKSLGQFSKALSRCTKGSRRWKKLNRAKGRLKGKTEAQVKNLLHHATRRTINWCQEQGVSELIIGKLTDVARNTKKKKRLGRKARQKVSQMESGRITRYLQYKAKEAGITTCLVGEHGTSSNCPECDHTHRPSGRNYICPKCGFTCHRDGKAAFMMIRKKRQIPLPEKFRIDHQQSIPTYRKQPKLACVDGADVTLSSLSIADSLHSDFLAA